MVTKSIDVLLVEDNAGDARLFREMFKESASCDANVVHVDSMRAYEEYTTDHVVDVIILDLGLPDARGLEALRRAHAAARRVAIVVLTGLDDELLAMQALQAGAQDYLVKGQIETHGLLRAIRYAVARKIMEVEIANDVADLKRAEAALRESELMLRLALDASKQGVWRWEAGPGQHCFQLDGHCRVLCGLQAGTPVTSALWASTIHADDRASAVAGLTHALDPADALDDYVCDYRVVHPDGSVIWIAAMGHAVFEPDPTEHAGRRAVRILGTVRDVSQAKRIEKERDEYERELERSNAEQRQMGRQFLQAREMAEHANQSKSRFLTGITHELRTPLHGILGYAELLSLEGGLTPKQSERVTAMIVAGKYLLGIINAVLDLSQIEADRIELCPVEIELPDFIRRCLDLVRSTAEAKGLTLSPGSVRPVHVLADSTRLRQVLINLLGNAIKFTPSGTIDVRVGSVDDGASVRMEVADTGPGVRAMHQHKLFQTFERLNAGAVSGIEGAGLGLAIAAQLVGLMGGQIGYADNPGGGSLFWVELPANIALAKVSKAEATSAETEKRGLRVLVVDDDALNRDIASGFLRFGGHEVICLDNGIAAVETAAAEDFDVILMDVRMPGMDGLEATRLIRALPGSRGKVPVVAVTAQAFAEQIDICRKAGMNTHVSKPFDQKVLLDVVQDTAPTRVALTLATIPTDTASIGIEPEPAVFDREAFEDATALLRPEVVADHIRTLIARGEALLRMLPAPDMLAHAVETAEAAHRLGGGAGAFGFLSLIRAARRFEFAADSGAAETVALAGQLATAIDAAVKVMRRELAGMTVDAP